MGTKRSDDKRDGLGFRRRGAETTRLEAFVDAAFAFALTLVVISVGDLPNTAEELKGALKAVPSFAACFWLLAVFWRGHVDWSERFGLDDERSRQWSLLLIFLVMIFVFPLKILFSGFFEWISSGALPADFVFQSFADVQLMFQTFAIAFGSLGSVMWALHRHAWSQRDRLGLDALEQSALRTVMISWALVPLFAMISIGLSFWHASFQFAAPGMVFFVMNGVQQWVRTSHRRRWASALLEPSA